MSDTYIIEVGSQPAGIVVRDTGGYRFFAASDRFFRLEGRLFRNAREAEQAARGLVTARVARRAADLFGTARARVPDPGGFATAASPTPLLPSS